MVLGIDGHRDRIARAVHVLGADPGGEADALGNLRGGLGQHPPFQVGFGIRLSDIADETGKAAHRRNAVILAQVQFQFVDRVEHLALDARCLVALGLDDHLQQVDADGEVPGDACHVLVVA
ncbi:hypothetical protein D3C86_1530540 [compost metagenome]